MLKILNVISWLWINIILLNYVGIWLVKLKNEVNVFLMLGFICEVGSMNLLVLELLEGCNL